MIRTFLTTTAMTLIVSSGAFAQTEAPAMGKDAMGKDAMGKDAMSGEAMSGDAMSGDAMQGTDTTDNAMQDAMDAAGDAMQNTMQATDSAMEAAGDAMGDAMDAGGNAMGDAMDASGNAIGDAMDATGAAMEATGDAMGEAMGDAMTAGEAAMEAVSAPWDMAAGYSVGAGDVIGSQLLGQAIYSGSAADSGQIGTINDFVFTEHGQISAVIVGVGGFLGIGEKNVAVDFHALDYVSMDGNGHRWVLPATAEELTAAPDFIWSGDAK